MATFTWTAGTSADWNVATDWTVSGGTGTPTPGSKTTATDIATLGAGAPSYKVTISQADEAYDLAALNLKGTGNSLTTLDIQGSLLTNRLAFSGPGKDTSLLVDNGGRFDLRTTLSAAGPETISIAGTGSGGLLELGSATKSGIGITSPNVAFNFSDNAGEASTGVIEYLSGFTAGNTNTANQKITGLAWGNSLKFDGADFTRGTVSYSGTTLTVTEADGKTKLVMHNLYGLGSLTSNSFSLSGDEIMIVCFAAGTQILTPAGERLVEDLTAGDEVLTVSAETLMPRPVKWVGRRRIDLAVHPRPQTVAPVRIRRGALADEVPHADVLLSPDHAVFVEGKLVCARQLINGTTIRQELDWPSIEYLHIELDGHAILLAEGLPAESYLDTGNRGFFANADAPRVLHPDLTDESGYPTRQAGSCAPFVWDEASVQPIWQRLAERAAALGEPVPRRATTDDASLHLIANGRTIRPAYADAALAIFALPRRATELRLVSRAASPTDTRPWMEDRRRLGVRVARIVLRTSDDIREVPVDHPDLVDGWWGVERDGNALRRWTDGDAALPLPAVNGDTLLEIRFGGSMTYLAETEAEQRRSAA